MALLEQRGVPFGVPQGADGKVTSTWRGWFDWVTKVCNAMLRGRFYQVQKITADYTMLEVDSAVLADATAGNIAVTLLDSRDATAKRLTIKKLDASANTVTAIGTIDDVPNLALTVQYEAFDLIPDPDSNAWWLA